MVVSSLSTTGPSVRRNCARIQQVYTHGKQTCVGTVTGKATDDYVVRFYGFSENAREIDLDMREMVGKVKRGEPLYGESTLTPHLQGVAARQSRFSGLFSDVLPWFNFVSHGQHGVDTAKYYRQAEKELEAERQAKGRDEAVQLG